MDMSSDRGKVAGDAAVTYGAAKATAPRARARTGDDFRRNELPIHMIIQKDVS